MPSLRLSREISVSSLPRFGALLTYFQGSRSELIDVLTGTGDVKLTKEDGSLITVPSYSKLMADMQDKALVSIDRLRFAMPATTTADVTYLWGTLVNFPQNGATGEYRYRWRGGI